MMNAFFNDPTHRVDRSCIDDITIPPFATSSLQKGESRPREARATQRE
jgi:hypothetical protein